MGDPRQPELDFDGSRFEDLSKRNGMLYWFASDLFAVLGYVDYAPQMKPLQAAMQVCVSLGMDSTEHFREERRMIHGKAVKDFKLSRFACYLISMNSDAKKPQVAQAQAYLASLAETVQKVIQDHQDIERVQLRQEVTTHEKSMAGVANLAGVKNYAYFSSKGYMGLYNMRLDELKRLKGVPDRDSPLDYMGPEELGANIFRITQTEAKIRRDNVRGQTALENTAYGVGREVRETIKRVGGTLPEDLPAEPHIKNIKSDLKNTQKAFQKKDSVSGPLPLLDGLGDEDGGHG